MYKIHKLNGIYIYITPLSHSQNQISLSTPSKEIPITFIYDAGAVIAILYLDDDDTYSGITFTEQRGVIDD